MKRINFLQNIQAIDSQHCIHALVNMSSFGYEQWLTIDLWCDFILLYCLLIVLMSIVYVLSVCFCIFSRCILPVCYLMANKDYIYSAQVGWQWCLRQASKSIINLVWRYNLHLCPWHQKLTISCPWSVDHLCQFVLKLVQITCKILKNTVFTSLVTDAKNGCTDKRNERKDERTTAEHNGSAGWCRPLWSAGCTKARPVQCSNKNITC